MACSWRCAARLRAKHRSPGIVSRMIVRHSAPREISKTGPFADLVVAPSTPRTPRTQGRSQLLVSSVSFVSSVSNRLVLVFPAIGAAAQDPGPESWLSLRVRRDGSDLVD